MRRHTTIPHKTDRKALYVSIFIAFIMITSAFGVIFYGYTSSSETLKYGNFKFKLTQQGYSTKIAGTTYVFENLPQDTEGINATDGLGAYLVSASGLAFTSDSKSSYRQDIALEEYYIANIMSTKKMPAINGFIDETGTLPKITCGNTTSTFPVAEFVESNTTEIVLDNGCIRIMFDSLDGLRRDAARIEFIILGVMNG